MMRDEKLLFVDYWNFPVNHRCKHMAAYLERRFRHVDLVGFEPFYSGSGPSTASVWHKARRGISNLAHRRIKVSVRNSIREIVLRDLYIPYFIHWMVDDLWHYLLLCPIITTSYDVAVWSGPGNALLAWLFKRSGKAKRLIYDDHDYFPGQEQGWIKWLVEKRERLCVRQADGVVSVNDRLARLRVQQGAQDVLVVPNGVDLVSFARARQKTPHPPTLVYMGNLSPLWCVELAIKAMPVLLQAFPDLRLLIIGEGVAEIDLRTLSHKLGVAGHIDFLGRLDYQALPDVLARADVGLATSLPDSEFRQYATPLKLVEYMAAGLPVIASRVGQTETILQQAQAGVLINHSVEELAEAAIHLLADKKLYENYYQAAITYANGFDWDVLMERVYQYVLYVVAKDMTQEGQ